MSMKAGRVGVHPADVDPINGHISPSAVDGYTKAQADNKFATIENAQPKTLAVPISMLVGSQLVPKTTVESVLETMDKAMTNVELTDAVNAVNKVVGVSTGTNFSVPLTRINNDRRIFGLFLISAGLYHIMIRPSSESNTVSFTKIYDGSDTRTLSGTYDGTTLSITSNENLVSGAALCNMQNVK